MKFQQLALLAQLVPTALAWGSLGHQTVAYIATNFVSPQTTTLFQTILRNNTEHYLAGIATWADSFRYTAAGRFSAPLHFIDAEDAPPSSCGVKYARDCGGNACVVGAIQNYVRGFYLNEDDGGKRKYCTNVLGKTSQILNPDLVAWRKNMAARFVVHFVGDIHQPLHDEGLLRGGNSISVNFTNKVVNLHHVWDTSIPEHLIGGYSLQFASAWANNLTVAIREGVYQPLAEDWLKGIDLGDPLTTALGWAQEANAFICTTVLPQGVEGVEGKELSGEYYDEGVKVVQLQIARAGLRLAKWLDLIAGAVQVEREEL